MDWVIENLFLLAGMVALLCCSAFFSASEAAMFYLSHQDRQRLSSGNRAQRTAARLIGQPNRLLTAVLFWNLLVNIVYFSMSSIVSIKLSHDTTDQTLTVGFAVVSLLSIIFLSEMLPKSLAVMRAPRIASWVALPLAVFVKLVDPFTPIFRLIVLLSRRLVWPRFEKEPYLEVGDLVRAVKLSKSDASLLEQEQTVLQNIVSLSDIRADELMRPRNQFRSFHPPVSLEDLGGELTPSGYVLVTERGTDEIEGAIALQRISDIPQTRLEHFADDVLNVPWCASVSSVLQQLRDRDLRVAAVVNEFGETIGILTRDDIFETIFLEDASRSDRLLNREPITKISDSVWHVTGMARLKRLSRYFGVTLPASKGGVTLAGVVQESLEHLPRPGDRCQWGPFVLDVLEAPRNGPILVKLVLRVGPEDGQ